MYTAIIIEPRKHKAFSFIIKNILDNLDSQWNIQFFHGNNNKEYIEQILEQFSNFSDRFIFTNLGIDNIVPYPMASNRLLTNIDFINSINTEIFLIFHLDAMIISENKDNINNFLMYDYFGAPWITSHPDDPTVGNGGLSLRRKSKLIETIKTYPYDDNTNEDGHFSIYMKKKGYNIPTRDEAKYFSSETILSNKSFGIHSIWRYHSKKDIINVYGKYSTDIFLLEELQGVI
jgi:hypothetical protein